MLIQGEGWNAGTLRIERMERDDLPHLPSVRVAVTLSGEGFQGSYDSVWLEDDEVRRFLAELEAFERTRQGPVHLSAMSPDEFELTVKAVDRVGHFRIEASLQRLVAMTNGLVPFTVAVALEPDPGSLPRMMCDLRALLPAHP